MTVHVFGHRNPDTDAICSALAYADFLRRTTRPDAVAACCGPPNQRTEFALRKAKLAAPKIIMDVRPELEDICNRDVVVARTSDVFYEVYERMDEHELRAIPVLDDNDQLIGLVTLLDLLELVFQGGVDPYRSREVHTNLDKVVSVLGGSYQHSVDSGLNEDMILTVGAMSAGGFCERMKQFPSDRLLVVSGDRPTIQLPALEMGVRGLVVTGGYQLSSGLMELARGRGVTVINSPFDTATTTMRIKAAQLIEEVITRDFLALSAKLPVAAAKQQIYRSAQTVFPVVDNQKLIGVLSKSDMVHPPRPQLVLVDHNEIGQAVEGAEDSDIVEVLDHHRLGGSLKSTGPIRFIMDPVGSTCTLVARMFRQEGLKPEPGMALCMASGIISDTLYLRSPTTTDVDRDLLAWLQEFCTVELADYANEFFEIGSALRSCTPDKVVREDCKQFEENGRRFSISQIEEIGLDLFWERQAELSQALVRLSEEQGLEFSALLVTDISSNGSLLLMSSEPDGWEEINYPQLEDRLYKLDNVVSRKKQLLPLISSLLEHSPEPT
ncbi:putative manganese-dependent inorganic diphosphatase [Rhodopirellula sp. P2]|uniref:putative manganese-dependent inorganic diphosphatase n=1 Tax=Rhodopirellula sp. P2 TaxID=2127060 RepID=UPI00236830B5|nr:putative manganese-dependent inorganic diphosphatase [Rhodopirellula sp. P2]WDQ18756.1 putative manganese-dependent inorganic diphosphatase [Rhodopirellula sp. P2]